MVEQSGAQPGQAPLAEGDATVVEEQTAPETRSAVDSTPRATARAAPNPGHMIGRFLVLDRLGAGGMGVVVSAHDPSLDRRVAIKMLHGERWAGAVTRGRAQLIAEAQAMAKLAHPNVVGLHEIGFDPDGAFLVMEYVRGATLRDWIDTADRPWREVVAMFVAAGEGLAAAHRAGIVHRDFKPDNVLVDRDGRARVGDFGLAAIVEGAQVTGSRSGTLPYMAPEQLRGEPYAASADQFAYCVALWEALHGNRPFAGTTVAERLTDIEMRRFVEPVRRPPEWLRAALLRGLASNPAERWPSLEALLDALRRDPRAKYRQRGAALALVAAAGTALWFGAPRARVLDQCSSAAARLAGVWDSVRKARVQVRFAATNLPYAADAWRGVRDRLDRYATDWVAMAGDTCRATRVDGRQSETLMRLRTACLEQRRSVLGALTAVWASGVDAEGLEHALDAAARVPPLAECGDARGLGERTPMPTNPVQVSRIDAAHRLLADLQAGVLARRLLDAKLVAARVRVAADVTSWLPIRAEASLAEAEMIGTLNDATAATHLIEASQLADAAHDDRLRARALVLLVADLADRQRKPEDAARFADLADGALARAGDDDALRGCLLHARGKLLVTAGKYAEARAMLIDARARLARALGPADEEAVATESDLAHVASRQADHVGARQIYEESVAFALPALGASHPRVARLLGELATTQYESGDGAAAAATYARALAIDENVFGPEGLETARTLDNLARLEDSRHNGTIATAMHVRALAIRQHALGPEHPSVALALASLALHKLHQREYASALFDLQRALAIKLKAYRAPNATVPPAY